MSLQQVAAASEPTAPLPAGRTGHRIRALSVIGGFLDGVQLEFADGLNCIIGGRGTGKTTVLELIRFALDMLPDRRLDAAERRRIENLVAQNLAGGRVELWIEIKDGLAYTVSRSWGEEPIVLSADGRSTGVSLRNGRLFRADIYSQNEVERVAERTDCQLALIDRFEPERIARIEAELVEVQTALASNASRISPLQEKLASLREKLALLPSVEEKLRKFAPDADEQSQQIDRAHHEKALRDRQQKAVESAEAQLRETDRQLRDLVGNLKRQIRLLFPDELAEGPNRMLVGQISQRLCHCSDQVDRLLAEARCRIAEAENTLAEQATLLLQAHQQQELAFRRLIDRHEQARTQAAERAQLERLRNDLLATRQQARDVSQQLESLHKERRQLLARLWRLREERFAVRRQVVERINRALLPAIRVELTECGARDSYRQLLERALRGAGLKHSMAARRLAAAIDPGELRSILKRNDTQMLVSEAGLNPGQARKAVEALRRPELLFELETVELADRPRIELKDGPGYKESQSLSTGQKCTAVLPILLLDSERPLLVDQPEDNLDNRFVFEAIVESVRRIKRRRQLIFVTHNPNIPVLGDAERLFVLASDGRQGRKLKEGTVDECKAEIIGLLEGGQEAFEQRRQRYEY